MSDDERRAFPSTHPFGQSWQFETRPGQETASDSPTREIGLACRPHALS